MTGYVRVDTSNNIADGNVISAADLDNEFDGVVAAFNATTGHTHGGGVGEGAPITKLGPTNDVTVSASLLAPKTTNTVDIGSSSLKFKDLYLAGNASIGGTLAVTGATTLSAALTYGGVTLSNAVTGTGNMVLSASPTLTGTISGVNASLSGTLAVTGVATLTAQPILSSLTASRAVFTDGSKGLVSNAITGTGNVVMSASPTLTGTITAEALTTSSTVTLNGGTANGVAYLNASKVLTTGSALTFDGTNLGVGTAASDSATFGRAVDLRGTTGGAYYAATTDNVTRSLFGTFSGAGYLGTETNHPFVFRINAIEQMRLTSTGLGIGTSSPGVKLDVVGVARASTRFVAPEFYGSSTGITQFMDSLGTTGMYVTGAGASPSNSIRFFSAGTTTATLDSSGNLGLGVTPSAWYTGLGLKALQVGEAAFVNQTNGYSWLQRNAFADASNVQKYIVNGHATRYQQGDGTHSWSTAPSGTAGNAISFTQAMTLDASGTLLIGRTSGVSAGARIAALSTGDTALQLTKDGVIATRVMAVTSGLAFGVDGGDGTTERARIDSSGNLGLGVVPSAWDTSVMRALQVGSGATFAGDTPGAAFRARILANAYYGSGAYRYIGNGPALLHTVNANSSTYEWNIAPTGTAGNAISFTQAMTLDASGNLMVGRTSAIGGARVSAETATGTPTYAAYLPTTGTETAFLFVNPNGTVGSITTNGTATTYATSSDYRLKNITGPITTSGAYIDSLNPVEGTWKADGSTFVGLIAHEVQEASRTTVATGVKDGEEMQGMDYSSAEIIANLIAEVKALRIRVAALEAA